MQTIFQKIKEIAASPEVRLRIALDDEVRFSFHIELASLVAQWVGIFANNALLILLGTIGFWYGFVKYIKNILRVYDEWKAEEEKKESDSNKDETS